MFVGVAWAAFVVTHFWSSIQLWGGTRLECYAGPARTFGASPKYSFIQHDEVVVEAPTTAREARALPGKDASLRAANIKIKAERSASAKIYLFASTTERELRLSLTRYEIGRNAGNSTCCF